MVPPADHLPENGETITEQVDYPIGDFKNPLTGEMADRKFRLLTEDMIGEEGVTKLLDRLHRLKPYRISMKSLINFFTIRRFYYGQSTH